MDVQKFEEQVSEAAVAIWLDAVNTLEEAQGIMYGQEQKELFRLHARLCAQAFLLMLDKNRDYANAEDPYRNFRSAEYLQMDARQGLLLRMLDKIARLNKFAVDGVLAVKAETCVDSTKDVINYAVLYQGITADAEKRKGRCPECPD